MLHAMLDLETFGTKAGCVLRSIGMVFFDPESDEMGPEFYANLTEEDQLAAGAFKDPATVDWWNRPSLRQAQEALLVNQVSLVSASTALCSFFKSNRGKFVWGQGANFDVVLLEHSMGLLGQKCPWLYYNARDTRTAYGMAGFDTKSIDREGTYHNALDDAKHQARCVQASYAKVRS